MARGASVENVTGNPLDENSHPLQIWYSAAGGMHNVVDLSWPDQVYLPLVVQQRRRSIGGMPASHIRRDATQITLGKLGEARA